MAQTKRTSSRYFSVLYQGGENEPKLTNASKRKEELNGKLLVSSASDFQRIMKSSSIHDSNKDHLKAIQVCSRQNLDVTIKDLRERVMSAPQGPLPTSSLHAEPNQARIRSFKFCVPHDLRMSFGTKLSRSQKQRHPRDGTSSRFQHAILGPTENRQRALESAQKKR
mmetsp:Transcript_15277/g.35031  ORF Transcript_15277/g.35031 Transcript_15277/m.35031 type:complete len:167 (-) Transcript_15277:394-894(-)|eukprot:768386-Hanusia_phi.AAC.4